MREIDILKQKYNEKLISLDYRIENYYNDIPENFMDSVTEYKEIAIALIDYLLEEKVELENKITLLNKELTNFKDRDLTFL